MKQQLLHMSPDCPGADSYTRALLHLDFPLGILDVPLLSEQEEY